MGNVKRDFLWFKNNKKMYYFDNAATTLKPTVVLKAIHDFYSKLGTNPHNTDSLFCYNVAQQWKKDRETISTIFNCHPDHLVFTSGATESLSLAANGICELLGHDDEILLNSLEHTSNLIPWIHHQKTNKYQIRYLSDDKVPTEQDIIHGVTSKTKVVAFSCASNVYGNFLDYKKVVCEIKKIDPEIIIVLDATQYLPHQKIDVTCGVDFVACSAHKILGPMGLGALYIREKWMKSISPLRYGGGMTDIVKEKEFSYAPGYDKFEGGSGNIAGVHGWAAAIKYIDRYGWDKLYDHELKLKKYFVQELQKINNVEIYNPESPLPIIIFNYKNVHSQDFANWLGSKNIIVRAGLSCAKLSDNIFKVPSFVRASLYLYNTKREIDYFIDCVRHFKKGDELLGVTNNV